MLEKIKSFGEKATFLKKYFSFKSFFGSLVGKIEATDKPLNWLSIVFLVAFDIFIFVNIWNGLQSQRDNIVSPYVKYSYACQSFFETSKDVLDSASVNTIYRYEKTRFDGMDENAPLYRSTEKNQQSDICGYLEDVILKIKVNPSFVQSVESINALSQDRAKLETKKNEYENNYAEFREDYKAGLTDAKNRLSSINMESVRHDYDGILSEIKTVDQNTAQQLNAMNALPEVGALKKYTQDNKQDYQAQEAKYRFWYPVFVTLMEIILVLPLLLVSLGLYHFALKRRLRILSILASNLSFITGLFAIYLLFKVVYWLLPKKFFVNLFAYLASMKLLAIWNYILIIIGLVIFGLCMYLSQKSIEKFKKLKEEQARERDILNKDRVQKERFWAGACIDCNKKLLPNAHFCSNCGAHQYRECSSCHNAVPKVYAFCEKCGK